MRIRKRSYAVIMGEVRARITARLRKKYSAKFRQHLTKIWKHELEAVCESIE